MVTDAGTDPDDVRKEIDTALSDADINDVLDLVERDVDREYADGTGPFDDSQHRLDFEAALAAYRIATANAPDDQDRAASEVGTGRTSVTYEVGVVESLRQRVQRRDPQGAFGQATSVRRDSNRHVTVTDP